MFNRLTRIFLLSILILSFALTACRPEVDKTPAAVQTQTSTGEAALPALTATPSPSLTAATASPPTVTPTVMPSPTATQPWTEIGFAQTPLPDLAGWITTENTGSIRPLAVWGNGRANGISLSPDGQVLGVATNLGAAFYDSQSYIRIALVPTALPVRAIAFSANNLQAALGLSNGAVEIIDRGNFSSMIRLTSSDATLADGDHLTLAYSPDSSELFQVIETTGALQIHRWNTGTWQAVTNFSLDSGWTVYTSASLDLLGRILDEDLTLQSLKYPEEKDILDLPTSIAPSFWTRMISEGGKVAASSDGEFILISNGIAIAHWELLSDEYTYLLDDYPNHIPDPCSQAPNTCLNTSGGFSWACEDDSKQPIELIMLTPDDVMVLISRNDNLTEFRRVSDSLMLWDIEATFIDIAFSPGGEFFFGLRSDGTIEKRATLDGAMIDLLDLHPDSLTDMAFSPDGSVFAASFSDGWIRVFSAVNGEMLGVLTGDALSLQFSPNGTLLAAGLEDGTVRIFILEEGSYYDINPGHLAAVESLAFSPTGDLLLTGGADCTTSLWNIPGCYRARNQVVSEGSPYQVKAVLLGWDGQTEFIAGNRTGITISPNSTVETLLLPEVVVRDLVLSPEGTRLATAGEGLHILFIGEDGVIETALVDRDLAEESFSVAVDGYGALLADATLDEIRLWSLSQLTLVDSIPLAAFVSEDNPPVALAFSPNDSLIVLATADGLIQVFGIPAGMGQ